jgi:hypothetical protein
VQNAVVSTLNCGSFTQTGFLSIFETIPNVSFFVPYNGGNGGAYPAESVNATGTWRGVTAVRSAGTLNNGSGTVTYTINGGNLQFFGSGGSTDTSQFVINLGGKTCTVSLFVNTLGAIEGKVIEKK